MRNETSPSARFVPARYAGVLDGKPYPAATDLNGVVAGKKANNSIYSTLFLMTVGSANITVRAHENTERGCSGNGAAVWNALKGRFDIKH